ncbi:MAG: sugar metabolism transcriptional regulator [Alphaproteobacteria bacterium]|nr:sugar metabolism transcriptional regulator [Alphaproteobacteria bacterium]MBF0251194.1 sugar metabolism transcriptional regulator [Alphaproteobacteria bacterium]
MILSDIRAYMAKNKRATETELTAVFSTTPEMVRDILAVLEHKGCVRPTAVKSCAGCTRCAVSQLTEYEWVA